MSVIRNKDHSESIYDLKKKPQPEEEKPEKYTSKYRPLVKEAEKADKFEHKTFGLAEVPVDKPTEFLKKYTRITPARPVVEGPRCLASHRHPPLPAPTKPPPRDRPTIDFRHSNVVKVVRTQPKEPEMSVAVTRVGDRHLLKRSGLVPHFTLGKSFGKTPRYLSKRILELHEKQCAERAKEKDKPGQRCISSEDRKQLLDGMNKNWQRMQNAYQVLPMMTDNISKIKQKLKLESDLKELERDIRMLERHPVIYVVDKDDDKTDENGKKR